MGKVALRVSLFSLALGGLCPKSVSAAVAYLQGAYATPRTPQTTVQVTFAAAQKTGSLNVVIVGWNDTTNIVSSVTDSQANTYQLAVGPIKQSTVLSQSIYYAKNIAAGSNAVTVTFSGSASYPDIRILEYSGIDTTNPVDVVAGAAGSSSTTNSGSVTTTNAADLLVGANTVVTLTSGPGSGYTQRACAPVQTATSLRIG